jgi:acyl-CoA synthetase (AMP-forming)/AMP-acid ligase II
MTICKAALKFGPPSAPNIDPPRKGKKAKLGSVKTPKSIDFVAEIPKSPGGKVLKTELRKPYWADQGRAVN